MLSTKFPYKIWIKISDYYIKVFTSLNSFGKKRKKKKQKLSLKRQNAEWADKWIPAFCRNSPLCAETPPSQTEVILTAFEMKANPNPHIPLTRFHRGQNAADARWELPFTNGSSGLGGRGEMGRRKRRENSCWGIQEQQTGAASLSISEFNFMRYLHQVRIRAPHRPFWIISMLLHWGRQLCLQNWITCWMFLWVQ